MLHKRFYLIFLALGCEVIGAEKPTKKAEAAVSDASPLGVPAAALSASAQGSGSVCAT
jgi:hypothetical protein